MQVTTDLLQFVPEGATHALVEERLHRGQKVWSVAAIIPHGARVVLNGYSDKEMADEVARQVNAYCQERA